MNYKKFFPILDWLPNYKKEFFKNDLGAGLAVGIMLIPQGIAYAMIAGLPPPRGAWARPGYAATLIFIRIAVI